jgi:hypothetical protein
MNLTQEEEDDEDINTVYTHGLFPSSSYKLSSTWPTVFSQLGKISPFS